MSAEIALELGRIKDRALRAVGEKVLSQTRLSHADAELLFTSPDLLSVGMLADYANRRKHGDVVTFAANQHINPTNVCYLRKTCVFCSFARLPKEEGAYHYTLDQVFAEAEPAASGLTKEFHIVIGKAHQAARFIASGLLRSSARKNADRGRAKTLENILYGPSETIPVREQQDDRRNTPRHSGHGAQGSAQVVPHGRNRLLK